MWDMLLSFLPVMLVILGILIIAIVTLKLLEARRNAKLKREYEAQQKKGDIDGLIIDSRKT
jgi:NADH:ubiquinone oxidoreductase subunit 3 (subunit A)